MSKQHSGLSRTVLPTATLLQTSSLLKTPLPKTLLPVDWLEQPLSSLAILAPLQRLHWPEVDRHGVSVLVKREDMLSPTLGGNKFYKLYYHLKKAKALGLNTVLTFGGAYSNHLYALAAAGTDLGMRTIGVIRGERAANLSPTLSDVEAFGMHLHFISRVDYRDKQSAKLLERLHHQFGLFYCVPEGGGDALGAKGCAELMRGILSLYQNTHEGEECRMPDAVCVASGTGSTAAGLVAGLSAMSMNSPTRVEAMSVLKGGMSQQTAFANQINAWVSHVVSGDASCHQSLAPNRSSTVASRWALHTDFHAGGYAKFPEELKRFVARCEKQFEFELDPVYTAKLFFAIESLAERQYWPKNSAIVAIHTGGIQGRRGFP